MRVFRNGMSFENPLTVLMIGLCSVLAVSTKAEGSFFMFTPDEVRIPIFIVVIASFVTIVDLVMKAYLPSVYQFLGVWIPLIVVNCIVLGRAEAFAYTNTVSLSVADGLGMGIGYTIILVGIAAFRELFGGGQLQFLGATLVTMPAFYRPPNILLLFPGAFILFGLVIAGSHALNRRLAAREAARAAASTAKGVA
jgi:electron transport complex protein RnfE